MIEDDEGHARLIEKNIRRAGVNNENLSLCERHGWAELFARSRPFRKCGSGRQLLILLDLNLPDMTGIDILEKLMANKHTKRSPVVVLTTTDDSRGIQHCYDLGANVYITKPVNYKGSPTRLGSSVCFLQLFKFRKPIETMPSNPARVLYVDDDPELARLVGRALGRRGYAVENVPSGEAGLARLAEGGVDVIALDHFLSIGTGLDS